MFLGRKDELNLLNAKYLSEKSELIVIYGRRRIGKTTLIKKLLEKKPNVLSFEGIEGERSDYQINRFSEVTLKHAKERFTDSGSFKNWDKIFSYLTEKIITDKRREEKYILFFDEIQWMAAGRTRLIAVIKYFWDNFWKDYHVMLILCGSIASFMVSRVISSNALYGRITTQILLKGLQPDEVAKLFQYKRSREEIIKYQLVFGGVPKYLEEVDLNKSFNQNINILCFSRNSIMLNEVEKIFYSQFRKAKNYIRIVNLLKNKLLSLNDIAKKLGKKSGGSLKDSLRLLEDAEIIKSYVSFDRGWQTKFKKYKLSDEYLSFYYKFIEPNKTIITDGFQKKLFEIISKDNLDVWLGFAFERFCLKHSFYIAEQMGFADQIISYGPYFSKKEKKFQIDLIFMRVDKVITVCEVKYYSKEISTRIIQEMERKISLLKIPRGFTVEKGLISLYGPDKHLKESKYFNYHVTIDDIIPNVAG